MDLIFRNEDGFFYTPSKMVRIKAFRGPTIEEYITLQVIEGHFSTGDPLWKVVEDFKYDGIISDAIKELMPRLEELEKSLPLKAQKVGYYYTLDGHLKIYDDLRRAQLATVNSSYWDKNLAQGKDIYSRKSILSVRDFRLKSIKQHLRGFAEKVNPDWIVK